MSVNDVLVKLQSGEYTQEQALVLLNAIADVASKAKSNAERAKAYRERNAKPKRVACYGSRGYQALWVNQRERERSRELLAYEAGHDVDQAYGIAQRVTASEASAYGLSIMRPRKAADQATRKLRRKHRLARCG